MLALCLALPSCASTSPRDEAAAPAVKAAPAPEKAAPVTVKQAVRPEKAAEVPAQWLNLRRQLARDGLSGPQVDSILASLGPRIQVPMGRKMLELYKRDFLPKPKPPKDKAEVYPNVVTEKNAALCRAYISTHQASFDRAFEKYNVPASVAAALLFVETRLGRVLRDVPENALVTLASMSQCTAKKDIAGWLGKMPGHEQHNAWFAELMPKRAAWAYNETKALVRYMLDNGITADRLTGSIYGAIGLCQFMPSNIKAYGVDGNGDGVIDLYTVDDAVMSLSFYLAKHGWKAGSARTDRQKVLMRYNKSVKYANTILALADLIESAGTDPGTQGS